MQYFFKRYDLSSIESTLSRNRVVLSITNSTKLSIDEAIYYDSISLSNAKEVYYSRSIRLENRIIEPLITAQQIQKFITNTINTAVANLNLSGVLRDLRDSRNSNTSPFSDLSNVRGSR